MLSSQCQECQKGYRIESCAQLWSDDALQSGHQEQRGSETNGRCGLRGVSGGETCSSFDEYHHTHTDYRVPYSITRCSIRMLCLSVATPRKRLDSTARRHNYRQITRRGCRMYHDIGTNTGVSWTGLSARSTSARSQTLLTLAEPEPPGFWEMGKS